LNVAYQKIKSYYKKAIILLNNLWYIHFTCKKSIYEVEYIR
jgi:hypothetical protein